MLKEISHECRPPLLFHPPLGRAETCDCLLSSTAYWRLDICISTRNPFVNLWVKASANAHPRIKIIGFCLADNLIICAAQAVVNSKTQLSALFKILPNSIK